VDAAEVAVDALATFRLVRLVQRDSIIDRPRQRAFAWLDDHHPRLSELGECSWCLSIWVAAGVVVARRVAPTVWGPVARLLAASAVAGIASERLS
jgi:hypothetical protein